MSKKKSSKKKSTGLLAFLFSKPPSGGVNRGLHKTMNVKDPWSSSYKIGHAQAKARRAAKAPKAAKPGSWKSWKNS